VKVVDWGTKSSGPSCQVISMITGDPTWSTEQIVNTGIEECIAVEPDINTGTPVTVFHIGPKQAPGTALEGLGLAPYIRNCFVDCGALTLPLSPDIRALSMSWCRNGVVDGNQIRQVRIGGPFVEGASASGLLIRDNTYQNVRRGPHLKLGQKTGNPITVNNLTFSGASEFVVLAPQCGASPGRTPQRRKVHGHFARGHPRAPPSSP